MTTETDYDADAQWRKIRNETIQLFRDCGIDEPDVEEIAIQADRGMDDAPAIMQAILADRRGDA